MSEGSGRGNVRKPMSGGRPASGYCPGHGSVDRPSCDLVEGPNKAHTHTDSRCVSERGFRAVGGRV